MTLYQFNFLNESQQAETLWENGEHIGEREDHALTIALYQIDSFYVEVFYDQKQNAIKRFRSFSSIEQLRPHLEQINVNIH